MFCKLLAIINLLEEYTEPLTAYADGARGEKLRNICFYAFMDSLIKPEDLNYHPYKKHLNGALDLATKIETCFLDGPGAKVSFAGMLP
jgi:hypothetical protein